MPITPFRFGVARVPINTSVFETIEAKIRTLDVDEIKQMLEPIMIGYHIRSPNVEPGTFVYRARKVGPTFNKAAGIKRGQLVYPPKEKAPLGRVNRAGTPVFYASIHKESVFYEIPDLSADDELILTFWKTTEPMFVNNIGYTEFAFRQLGAARAVPTWEPASHQQHGGTEATVRLPILPADEVNKALSHDENREIKEAFSRYFSRQIMSDESFYYKLTVALAEMHLGNLSTKNPQFFDMIKKNPQFSGILYPSVRMFANGDNLALLPWFVDRYLEFRKAVHIRIKGRTATTFNVEYLDAAHGFDVSGNLAWLGRICGWTLKPQQGGQFLVVAGRDEDGDYVTAKDGTPVHWVATDMATGEPLHMG